MAASFHPNYPVARITKVERPAGEPFATIVAIPLAQLDKSCEVLLVWRNDTAEKTKKILVQDENNPANKVTNIINKIINTITDTDTDTDTETENKVEQKKESTLQGAGSE